MIKCPECGSTDVYFEYSFAVWQKADGNFELDDEQVNYVLQERSTEDDHIVCNSCGNKFCPSNHTGNKYKVYVSKIKYGSAIVEADSENEACEKIHNTKIEWHDSEILDLVAELIEENN